MIPVIKAVVLFFIFINQVYAKDNLYQAKVINVIDGDTINIKQKDNRDIVRVRLFGVDAPELNQESGKTAKKHLNSLIGGKNIEYKKIDTDSYGRIIATIYYNNQNINLQMIKDGFAWHYEYYYKSKEYKNAQKEAIKSKIGLWSKNDNPVPPWKFRNSNIKDENQPFINIPFDIFVCISKRSFDIKLSFERCSDRYFILIGKPAE